MSKRISMCICLIFGFSLLPASFDFDIAEAGYSETLLRLHNKERKKRGFRPLRQNAKLNLAALKYAAVMKQKNTLSHTGPNGSTVVSRVRDEGYRFSLVGENIASGYRSARHVHRGWMSNVGHRRNILKRGYRQVGIGKSGTYWCVKFGRPL